MSYEPVRQLAGRRFNEVFLYLQDVTQKEAPSAAATPEVKIMRGLFFVLLYGAFEKTVNEAVQLTLNKILTLKPKNCDVITPFNVISLSRRWKSVKDSGHKKAFEQMSEFFGAVESTDFHPFDDTLFGLFLQNIWAKSLVETLNALGASGIEITVSQRAVIDEVVNLRNSVAHGREAASEVGEGPRCADLRKKFDALKAFTDKLIVHLEEFIERREFIRPAVRAGYLPQIQQAPVDAQ